MHDVSYSEEARSLKPGFYEHASGRRYRLLCVAFHEATLQELVIYEALYDEHYRWARPLSEFLSTTEKEGERVPRFRYLGETLES